MRKFERKTQLSEKVPVRAYLVHRFRKETGEAFWDKSVRFCSAPCFRSCTLEQMLNKCFVMETEDDNKNSSTDRTIKIEGIEFEETQLVGELWDLLSAPDGFMHVVALVHAKNRRNV